MEHNLGWASSLKVVVIMSLKVQQKICTLLRNIHITASFDERNSSYDTGSYNTDGSIALFQISLCCPQRKVPYYLPIYY